MIRADGRTDQEIIADPHEGDIVGGQALGRKNRVRHVYAACVDCGKLRWRVLWSNNPRCVSCAAKRNGTKYNGEWTANRMGYAAIAQSVLLHPKNGDKLPGRYLDKANTSESRLYQYVVCSGCGNERWVMIAYGSHRRNKHPSPLCPDCRIGSNNHMWKGGVMEHEGYIFVMIQDTSPYWPMAKHKGRARERFGYIPQHRLVMAEHLGRCLEPWEIVHHKDGNRSNNDISNLELVTPSAHLVFTRLQQQIIKLGKQVKELETRNKLCEWHICQLEKEIAQVGIKIGAWNFG